MRRSLQGSIAADELLAMFQKKVAAGKQFAQVVGIENPYNAM
jgi:hypothetical protein